MPSKAVSGSFALFFKFCVEVSSDPEPHEEEEDVDGGPVEGKPLDGALLDASYDAATPDAGHADACACARPHPHVPPPVRCEGPPGLYVEGSCDELAAGVRSYRPRFPFWSDGSVKERFVYLPPGSTIDASDPDRWIYPVGTRVYKTFYRDGLRLETRLLEKTGPTPGPDGWKMQAFAWRADQRSVELVDVEGRDDTLGTTYDIPSVAECVACHSAAGQDVLNGFSAIQLNHEGTEVSLRTLIAEEVLVSELCDELPELAQVPGDLRTQAALGTLHTNCGICHGGAMPRAQMSLRLLVGETEVTQTALYTSAVGKPLVRWTDHVREDDGTPYLLRIAPGRARASGIVARMAVRGTRDQMPPLGTELVDVPGLAAVSAWIESLPQ